MLLTGLSPLAPGVQVSPVSLSGAWAGPVRKWLEPSGGQQLTVAPALDNCYY